MSSSFDILCNLLNEFYEDIRPDLVPEVFAAINASENAREFINHPEIFNSLRRLILNLANPQHDDSVALNIYITDDNTFGSPTRRFFRHLVHIPEPDIQTLQEQATLFLSQPSLKR
jgi:hypothetical protein